MDYANPQALVGAEWLSQNLGAENIKIVDGTYFLPGAQRDAKAEFATEHIPGSVFFDIDDIRDSGSDLPHMLPGEETFSAKVGALGIADSDKVVVYDTNGGGMAAARVWWMFRVFGHHDVCLLNGGMKAWLAEGRPVTNEAPAPEPAAFAAVKNDALVRTIEQMLANVESGNEQVIDARAKERFEGTAPEPREGARPGHIPGSLNLPFFQLMDNENNLAMRGADDIAAALEAAGVDLNRPVAASCGSGVTASMLAFGCYLIGKEDAAVYDGSWSEWGCRTDTPVET